MATIWEFKVSELGVYWSNMDFPTLVLWCSAWELSFGFDSEASNFKMKNIVVHLFTC